MKMRRCIAAVLFVVMIISLLPASVFAVSPSANAEGMTFTVGNKITVSKAFEQTPSTYEAWIKLPKDYTSRAGIILGNYKDTNNLAISFEIAANGVPKLYYTKGNTSTNDRTFSEVNVATGEWIHLAIVNDSAAKEARCYVDGELRQTISGALGMPLCENACVIGGDLRSGNAQYFKGEIHSVAVYTDVRTETEIQADMTAAEGDDLLSAWNLTDNLTAKTIADSSGNGYDAINANGVDSIPADTEGMTFAVSSSVTASKAFVQTPATYEAWIKMPADYTARGGVILGNYKDTATAAVSFELYTNGNPRLYRITQSGSANSITFTEVNVCTGQWLHLAIVNDTESNTISCYVNGELAQTLSGSLTLPTCENACVIGGDLRSGNAQYFKGQIHSVAVYSDARTESEIKADVTAAEGDDLLAAWNLSDNLTVKTITDLSGNGNDAINADGLDPIIPGDTVGMTFAATDSQRINKAFSQCANTYEAWVKFPTDFQTQKDRGGVILGNYAGNSTACVNLEIFSNGYPRIYYVDAEGTVHEQVFGNATVYTGAWTHLAIVNDTEAGKLYCYINGELMQTVNKSLPENVCENASVIGGDLRAGNVRYFGGQLHSVALYTDARTQEEIQADMNAVQDDNLLAAWDLTQTWASGVISDESGNGYDIINPWFTEKTPVTGYDYSFVVVGDTQIVNYNEPEKLACIYDWIVDNKEEKKIQYVLGMGDITDKNAEEEWENAYTQIAKLDANNIGYSLVRGNHDKTAEFNATFDKEPYSSSFAGKYNDKLENTWREIEVCGIKYLIFTLDMGASDAVLNWASEIIEAHPEHNVIITTHVYLYRDGTTLDANDFAPATNYGCSNNGDDIWDKLVKKHENIVLVLSGHDPCDYVVTAQDAGENGNIVTQMLVDPQGVDARIGATGMVTMLYFSEEGSKITVETYSTVKEAYFMKENQFELTIPVVGQTKKYAVTDAKTGEVSYGNNFADLVSKVSEGSVITLQDNITEDLSVSKNLQVDLNGMTVNSAITVAEGKTITFIDSKGTGKINMAKVNGTVGYAPASEDGKTVYVPVTGDDGYATLHEARLNIDQLVLRADNKDEEGKASPGLYFKHRFDGDDVVKDQVTEYGIAFSLVENEDFETSLKAEGTLVYENGIVYRSGNVVYTKLDGASFGKSDAESTSTLITGIMKEENAASLNGRNAQMPIYGVAYIKLSSGDVVLGELRERSFQQQLESVDTKWDELTHAQRKGVLKMYKTPTIKSVVDGWTVPNLTDPAKSQSEDEQKILRVLSIGNSHTDNATEYLYDVFKAENPDQEVQIAQLYYSGCAISQHIGFAAKDEAVYRYRTHDNRNPAQLSTMKQALNAEIWDVVILHEMNSSAGAESTYTGANKRNLQKHINYIKANCLNSDPKFIWNFSWANPTSEYLWGLGYPAGDNYSWVDSYQKLYGNDYDYMLDCMISNTKQYVMTNSAISDVAPTGLAFQYARKNNPNQEDPDVLLYCDYTHAGPGFGRLLASYVWYATLTGTTEFNELKYARDLTEAQQTLLINAVNYAVANKGTLLP